MDKTHQMDANEAENMSDVPPESFSYLEMPSGGFGQQETFRDKFLRKTKENPLVPMGLAATIAALSYGLWQMKTGDRRMSQKMMRMRIYAQGFTVFALISGIFWQSKRSSRAVAAEKKD